MKKLIVIVFIAALFLAHSTAAMPPPPKIYTGPVAGHFVRTKRALTWPALISLYGSAFATPTVPFGRAGIGKGYGMFGFDIFCLMHPELCGERRKPNDPPRE